MLVNVIDNISNQIRVFFISIVLGKHRVFSDDIKWQVCKLSLAVSIFYAETESFCLLVYINRMYGGLKHAGSEKNIQGRYVASYFFYRKRLEGSRIIHSLFHGIDGLGGVSGCHCLATMF